MLRRMQRKTGMTLSTDHACTSCADAAFVVFMYICMYYGQVFFSGCLHGDEQVGPTAVMEAAKLMVYAAVCDADSAAEV